MDPVSDPLLLRKSGSAGNRTRDPRICSQKLWPLDHRGGHYIIKIVIIRYGKHIIIRDIYSIDEYDEKELGGGEE